MKISGIKQNFQKILKFLLNISESSLRAKLKNVEELFAINKEPPNVFFQTTGLIVLKKTIYFSFVHKIVHRNLFIHRF